MADNVEIKKNLPAYEIIFIAFPALRLVDEVVQAGRSSLTSGGVARVAH
jgi:hypothetical protein